MAGCVPTPGIIAGAGRAMRLCSAVRSAICGPRRPWFLVVQWGSAATQPQSADWNPATKEPRDLGGGHEALPTFGRGARPCAPTCHGKLPGHVASWPGGTWSAGQVWRLDPDDPALVVGHYDKGIAFVFGADCRRPAHKARRAVPLSAVRSCLASLPLAAGDRALVPRSLKARDCFAPRRNAPRGEAMTSSTGKLPRRLERVLGQLRP